MVRPSYVLNGSTLALTKRNGLLMTFASPPIDPLRIEFDFGGATVVPQGPVLTRRMSDLTGLFAREDLRLEQAAGEDPVVYSVVSSPVPELARELPQSITTIRAGTVGGEYFMTKGHQHPDPQGEIYLGISGVGGLLMFDGKRAEWLEISRGVIGYIPPGWAHRSVNIGTEDYKFLAVYPGAAGHDYQWVVEHGMGRRAYSAPDGCVLRPFTPSAKQAP
jgi:glucose-6-phosphate isomerase